MDWIDYIEVYGEIGARAMEQAEARQEWERWIEGGAIHGQR